MSLPDSWVDKIFTRMGITYGAKWARLWEGIDIAAVKADWAEQLGRFDGGSIFYALRYLPTDNPPTVLQFRDLCRKAPTTTDVPKLEAPKADPERVRALLGRMVETAKGRGEREWAYELQSREQSGEILSPVQRMAWREALATAPAECFVGDFREIPADVLPPGMRNGS
jgi:hypothetical protein